MKVSQLKQNPRNPRKIEPEKLDKLVESVRSFPEMMEKRPIVCVTDVDGKLYPLGGNQRLKAIKQLDMKEIPDNWVVLADDWSEEQRQEFLIKDNVAVGEWDWEMLKTDWDTEQLSDWGLDMPAEKDLNEEDLFDIEIPFYEPSTIIPNISELADTKKTNELLKKIDSLNLEEELTKLLKARASFFIDFNFQNIADFYSVQEGDIRELFEDLGLVIIAPREALKRGFVELSEGFEL